MTTYRLTALVALWTFATLSNPALAQEASTLHLYIGTYTSGESEGIYRCDYDPATGALGAPALAAPMDNPSFLAKHPKLPVLYAVAEGTGEAGARVHAFQIGEDGSLTPQSDQATGGDHPCHVAVSGKGDLLAVANYSGGSIALFNLAEDGALATAGRVINHSGSGPVAGRQEGPHAHSVDFDLSDRYLLSADLGADRVITYPREADDVLHKTPLAPGSGPRHVAFHTSGGYLYVVNELNSTVTGFRFDATNGEMTELQTVSTLPAGFDGENSCAEIAVHPNGNLLYASNRGHDSLAIFSLSRRSGQLTPAGHVSTGGKTPRHFAIAPDGKHLLAANQNSNDVQVFAVNAESGALTATSHRLNVGAPVCLLFVAPSGN
ncbi:MAG: 6-phosphogluconolactonase [Candidatus Hydrogenedentota bacterium]